MASKNRFLRAVFVTWCREHLISLLFHSLATLVLLVVEWPCASVGMHGLFLWHPCIPHTRAYIPLHPSPLCHACVVVFARMSGKLHHMLMCWSFCHTALLYHRRHQCILGPASLFLGLFVPAADLAITGGRAPCAGQAGTDVLVGGLARCRWHLPAPQSPSTLG